MATIAFQDTLKDFEKAEEPQSVLSDQQEIQAPVIPSVSLHPDELDALKEEAYQRGLKDGTQQAEMQLSHEMTSSVKGLAELYEQSIKRQQETLGQLHEMMVDGVFNVVKLFIGPQLNKTELKTDLRQNVHHLVALFEQSIILSCSKEDSALLGPLAEKNVHLQIEIDETKQRGQLTIKNGQSVAILDEAQWMAGVRENIIKAAQAVMQLKKQQRS